MSPSTDEDAVGAVRGDGGWGGDGVYMMSRLNTKGPPKMDKFIWVHCCCQCILMRVRACVRACMRACVREGGREGGIIWGGGLFSRFCCCL